ncbi:MAG: ATP-binding protein [Sulfurimicrobium sp.]|nr:ATP-binding protein [Sulfurimicrobium sp.]MDP1705514.1 ATP-binding protein [Sulfurimicrobium sp.]MDP2200005.1 ATP-binding protein [Sulfurimicrobium sp.]MDP3687726.1 ATP-binding protein [Sulfurimicrobium sp.]
MRFLDSAPARLISLLLIVYVASAGLIFFFLDYQLTSTLTKGVDHTLSEERNLLQFQYRDYGVEGLYRAIQSEIESEGSQSHGFRILDQHNQITYQAGGLSLPLEKLFSGIRQIEVEASDGKIHPARVISFSLGDGLTAFTAVSMDPVFALVEDFRQTFLLTAGMVSLFGLAVGLWLARRFRSRIDAFNRNTNLIMQSGDLSSRMPVNGNDELSVLAGNMNAMLERIERLVQGIRQVSDNIAHDLRTPLTRLSSDVQVALQQEDPEAYHAALQRVHDELEKMQSIFSSLLSISRAESGGMPVKRAVVDFSELLNELLELYEPSAEERGLVLRGEVAEGLLVYGNRQLLAQIISNLFDNALKYVPAGGDVRLNAYCQDNRVKVVVEDGGPGIPPEMRDKVFERFARLDPSRTMAGSGLGLSLAKAFVELHHGSISIVKSALGGSAFLLDFPAA